MSRFIILVDYEKGHIFPAFGLAKKIETLGHEVHFLGITDIGEHVENEGFSFHPILESSFPTGYVRSIKETSQNLGHYPRISFIEMFDGEFQKKIQEINPDGIIVNTFLSLEALLIYYLVKQKPIIFTPYLVAHSTPIRESENQIRSIRKGPNYSGLIKLLNKSNHSTNSYNLFRYMRKRWNSKDISRKEWASFLSPLNDFRELIACPKEFDYPESTIRPNAHFIGPCIRRPKNKQTLFPAAVKGKKIVFVSLGSQIDRFKDRSLRFYNVLIQVIQDPSMNDFHFILSSGITAFEINHPNLSVFGWADTLEVLPLASTMINHGGLGVVKECIYFGVPMLALPTGYDQYDNANLIEYHRIGLQGDLDSISPDQLKHFIYKLNFEPEYKKHITLMKNVFQQKENSLEDGLLVEGFFKKLYKR